MLLRFLISFAISVLATAQTTTPPTWAQIYYEAPPLNAGLDYGTPKGQHDAYAQPVAPKAKGRARNVILVIPDGFGPASEVSHLLMLILFVGPRPRVLPMEAQFILE